jgi:hypothetical protein
MQLARPASRRIALVALAAHLLLGSAAVAAADVAPEEGVKAAYLFKFLGYVDWPATTFGAPDAPIVIGVSGADGVLAELQRVLPGRSVQGRPVSARKVTPGDMPEGVHVLFAGGLVSATHPGWLQRLRDKPVLLVTDEPEGLRHGGMLNFMLVQGKLRFEASVPSADRSGLKLSSRLLAVAERVVTTP